MLWMSALIEESVPLLEQHSLSSFLHQQAEDLLPGYTADFHAFPAASFAALNSNSRPGCFQKLCQAFRQRLVRPVFKRRGPQPHLQRASYFPSNLVLTRARLHSHRKHHSALRFRNVDHLLWTGRSLKSILYSRKHIFGTALAAYCSASSASAAMIIP